MKFLCVKCDQGMKLQEVSGPDEEGSLAVVYNCQGCDHQIAMLTNAHETQLITSLGVTVGPDGKSESKCPFSQALQGAQSTGDQAAPTESTGDGDISWSPEALERVNAIPEFVRPMVKSGMEKLALAKGVSEVSVEMLDEAKAQFGM